MPHSEDFNRAIRGARAGREVTRLMLVGYLCLLTAKAVLGALPMTFAAVSESGPLRYSGR
jgi:hypothetical protein